MPADLCSGFGRRRSLRTYTRCIPTAAAAVVAAGVLVAPRRFPLSHLSSPRRLLRREISFTSPPLVLALVLSPLSRARALVSFCSQCSLSLSPLPHTRIYSSYIPHTCTRIYARGDDYSPLCRCARVGIYTCTLFHYYYKLALLSSASAGGSTHALVRLAPSFLSPSILSSPRRGRCIYRYIHNTYPVHGDPGAVLLLLLAASSGSCTRKHGSSDTARR